MAYNSQLMAAIRNDDKNTFWNMVFDDQEMVKHTVEFNPEWNNGTGYYDSAVDAELPGVEIGEIARSRAPARNSRRLLLIKTTYGNVVLFERYTPDEDGTLTGPIIAHQPYEVDESEMLGGGGTGPLTMDQLVKAVGDNSLNDNIGLRLARFVDTIKNGSARRRRREELDAKNS
jgi:hypothetical protein